MNAREHLTAVLAVVNTMADHKLPAEWAKVIHDARNFLSVPYRGVVGPTMKLEERLNNLHPSRRGVKRNACALDMVAGASIVLYHTVSHAEYNTLSALSARIALYGADELISFNTGAIRNGL